MRSVLQRLINHLSDAALLEAKVIPWACPVLAFGDTSRSQVATLGINPSNLEFEDKKGNEIEGDKRRFHTLKSLGLKSWSEAKSEHLDGIMEYCRQYFHRNPYDGWFKPLNKLICKTGASFYGDSLNACHLDLVPYATSVKWGKLKSKHQKRLLNIGGDMLGTLIRDSPVKVIILNGRTVVKNLEKIAEPKFKKEPIPNWKLNHGVEGYGFTGLISEIGGVKLGRDVPILGFNHNLQSGRGMTNEVRTAMGEWLGQEFISAA